MIPLLYLPKVNSIVAAIEITPRSAQHEPFPHVMPKSLAMGQKLMSYKKRKTESVNPRKTDSVNAG
jgi:hypothetical protein